LGASFGWYAMNDVEFKVHYPLIESSLVPAVVPLETACAIARKRARLDNVP